MGFLEIFFYSINNYIVTEILFVTDVGGSIVVHTFGCYFGLTVSYILGKPPNEINNKSNGWYYIFMVILAII